ncbi:MAG: hypothetical protein GEU99_24265 [Luteitalea sp.]|nr:hypothetical protein [Luteitalea sp.]
MANTEHIGSHQWVEQRLRLLDPSAEWQPATAVALARFRARVAAPDRSRLAGPWIWLMASGLVCLLLMTLPTTRAAAQRLWDLVRLGRVDIVQIDVDLDKLPDSLIAQAFQKPDRIDAVGSVAQAADRARFMPRLPSPAVLPDAPSLSVLGPMSFGVTIDTTDLRTALDAAGATDQHVPPEWHATPIGLRTSAIVFADYPNLQLIQSLPWTIATPTGFDFGAFSEVVLRIVGLNATEARAFAVQLAITPAMLLAVSTTDAVSMRQVDLRTGTGTLLQDLSEDGHDGRVTLVWSRPNRLYMISASASVDEVIAVANSIE